MASALGFHQHVAPGSIYCIGLHLHSGSLQLQQSSIMHVVCMRDLVSNYVSSWDCIMMLEDCCHKYRRQVASDVLRMSSVRLPA